MATFKNVSPLGALDVPALGRVIDADEEFEVRADLAPLFAGQAENYEPVDAPAKRAAKRAALPVDETQDYTAGDGEGEVTGGDAA